MASLRHIAIRGFKSIRALEHFELGGLNILIGANGSGKSNFISLFQMLAALVEKRLQLYVQEHDGPDALLFGTRKRTGQMDAEFYFGLNGTACPSHRPATDCFSRARRPGSPEMLPRCHTRSELGMTRRSYLRFGTIHLPRP
jgi:energy-coupling factor transporter ATP-binding protein EcfA2